MRIELKNNSNYLWKIVFTFFIAYIHSAYRRGEYTRGWYLCVDFFFCSSGFVLAMTQETDTLRYIWKRTIKLWPHLFLSYILIYSFYFRGNIKEVLVQMLIHIGESTPFSYFFFDLEYAGIYPLNFPVWYITCLLLCSMVIHYLFFNHQKCFVSVIAPVLTILFYGHIYRTASSLNVGGDIGLFLNEYFLRAFAGMSVGVFLFYIIEKLKAYCFTKNFFVLVRIVEIVSMTSFTLLALKYGEQKTDIILLGILYIGTFCSFIHPEYNSSAYKVAHNIVKKCCQYTYAIYLNHIFCWNGYGSNAT